MRRIAAFLALLVLSGCGGGSSGSVTTDDGTTPGSWPQLTLTTVAGGFSRPLHVTHAGDGTGRLFVVEQEGRIRIVDNGVVLSGSFLDIASKVACCGERGLLSAAFPPGYASKGYFYVDYTRVADGATVVARYRVAPGDGNAADPASEEIVLTVAQPFANHNGGQVAFGPDGYMYIGMGDGGGAGDPLGNGQNLGTLLGKLLRIDTESGTAPYRVPPGNPFLGADNGSHPEIWASGLRNPWRFSFDRQTGDLYIGDVGQDGAEEIDHQPADGAGGENYGWRIMEGSNCFSGDGCSRTGLTLPVAQYGHSLGCSVTGGFMYRGAAFPPLRGIYLFGDYCSGRIWGLRKQGSAWEKAVLLEPSSAAPSISSFGEDEEGELHLLDYSGGALLRISVP